MAITRISSDELSRAPGKAKRAAQNGPVLITERGQPSFVLLTVEEYKRLGGRGLTLAEALAMPGEHVDFEPERVRDLPRPPNLG